MDQRPLYLTTPIYYANDRPHIGHAYSTIACDVMARYGRMRGRPTRFLTGNDEHGQKIEQTAEQLGISPQQRVDDMAGLFREVAEKLSCSFDDYIRTTEPRHKERVRELWKMLAQSGDIYLGKYEGWYSVADESFITEQEMKELDEVTKSKVQRVSEPSYFFKLSAYQDRLLEFYEAHPDFVQPAGRFNEVKAFVKAGLNDLSVSRTRVKWGIPVPDSDAGSGDGHTMFVWLDALTNYISALGAPNADAPSPLFGEFWAPGADVTHVVGKEIIRFHAIYWPAFLMSAGIEPPQRVWAHGWLTVDGRKMSKRFGNFIDPVPLAEYVGPDVVRYYLMREVGFGQDGDFSHKNLLHRYNGELANGLGNLLNRMVRSIVARNLGGKVPAVADGTATPEDQELRATAERVAREAAAHLEGVAPHRALDTIFELVAAGNRYIDQTAPWALAKNGETARLEQVAYMVLETLRWLSVLVAPFMPAKAAGLREQLGLAPLDTTKTLDADTWPSAWGELAPGTETVAGDPLFPRYDKKAEKEFLDRFETKAAEETEAKPAKKAKKKSKGAPPAPGTIEFDDFMKVELKLGLVLEAEAIEKSDKLIKLQIDLGEEKPRQVLAGIRKHYDPAELVGQRVVVVANLAPRKMMGIESQGMVLAASDDSGLSVLGVDKEMTPGTRVS